MGNTAQEDIFLQALVFSGPMFETNTFIPSYSKLWHTAESNVASFRFCKLAQQVMQWEKRTVLGLEVDSKRWLMKTPEHVGFVKDLMTVYPDAVWVLTHRDPVPVVQSFVPMILYIQGLWNEKINAEVFAEYQVAALEHRLNHLVEQIEYIPTNQVIHVPFREFNKDNVAIMAKICTFTGLSWEERQSKPW